MGDREAPQVGGPAESSGGPAESVGRAEPAESVGWAEPAESVGRAERAESVGRAEPAEAVIDLSRMPSEAPHLRRRRALVVGGVALAVVLVAAVAVVGVQSLVRQRTTASAAPSPSSNPSPSASPTAKAGPEDVGAGLPALMPLTAVFSDADHGYLMMLHCSSQRIDECMSDLSVTTDGGSTWSRRPLPGGEASPGGRAAALLAGRARLYVLDPRTLVVDRPETFWAPNGGEMILEPTLSPDGRPRVDPRDPTTLPGYVSAKRWLSRDAGATWREVSIRPVGTVNEVPAGGRLIFARPSMLSMPEPGAGYPETMGDAQVLRADGTTVRLRNRPKGGDFTESTVSTASDGSLWVNGWSIPDGPAGVTSGLPRETTVVLVSRDRGRTWRTVTTPAANLALEFYTVDGRSLYLVSYTEKGHAEVSYSFDAGRSWRSLAMPEPGDGGLLGKMLGGLLGAGPATASVAPLADGGLIVAAGGRLYRLAPGGSVLTAAAGAPEMVGVMAAGRWVLAAAPDMTLYYGSPDGVHWRTLDLT